MQGAPSPFAFLSSILSEAKKLLLLRSHTPTKLPNRF